MVIHHGRPSSKQKYVACGKDMTVTMSAEVQEVSCIPCIEWLLKMQKNRNRPTNKTPAWEARLAELKNKGN